MKKFFRKRKKCLTCDHRDLDRALTVWRWHAGGTPTCGLKAAQNYSNSGARYGSGGDHRGRSAPPKSIRGRS